MRGGFSMPGHRAKVKARPARTRRAPSAGLVAARTTPRDRDRSVQEFLDRFAVDLTAGRIQEIVTKWGIPSLVIADGDLRAVSSSEDVAAFFSGAKDQYNARGITDTRPDVSSLEWLTDTIVIAHVRWPYLDSRRREVGEERSSYILRREGNDFRFYVAVLRGASAPR